MKRFLFLLLPWLWLLAGCASGTPTVAKVPAAILCQIDVGPEPMYPDTVEAIRKAPGLYDRVHLLLEGRSGRDKRLGELQALKKCAIPTFGQ